MKAAKVERVATGTQHFDRRHVDLGMSEITRRIALAQDPRKVIDARRKNYFYLLRRLREVSPPLFNQLPAGACPLFYPLIVQDKPAMMARLRAQGVVTVDFWRSFHPLCDAKEFPEVAQLRQTVLEIPCHQDLSSEAMEHIADAVVQAMRELRPEPMRMRG